jgi:hypothetical protein
MELIDFKEKLEQKQKGMNIALSSAQRTFLYGSYYEITGRTANINCSSCDSYTYKILLNYLKIQEPKETTIQEQYFEKFNKQVPNRYKNDVEWIKSKIDGKE